MDEWEEHHLSHSRGDNDGWDKQQQNIFRLAEVTRIDVKNNRRPRKQVTRMDRRNYI